MVVSVLILFQFLKIYIFQFLKILYFLIFENFILKKVLENWIYGNLIFLRFVSWSTRRCKRLYSILLRIKDISMYC